MCLGRIAAHAVRAGDILRRLRSMAQSQAMKRLPGETNATVEGIRELILAEARRARLSRGAQLRPRRSPSAGRLAS